MLSETEIIDLVKSDRPWNVARRAFATYAARLSIIIEECADDDTAEKIRATNLKIRRLEFEAAEAIARAVGVMIADRATGEAGPVSDPEGLKEWLGEPGALGKGPDPGGPPVAGPAGEPPLGPENVVTDPSREPGSLP